MHVAVAELVLDLPQLLAQVVVALGLRHLLARAVLDLRLHLQDADLLFQRLVDARQPLDRLVELQQLLRLGHLERQVRGDEVGHPPRIVDALHDHRQLGLDRLAEARTACRCCRAPSAAAPRSPASAPAACRRCDRAARGSRGSPRRTSGCARGRAPAPAPSSPPRRACASA